MPNRDDYTRCKFCFQLFLDDYGIVDPDTGAIQCPSGCLPSYEQPPYESPLLD